MLRRESAVAQLFSLGHITPIIMSEPEFSEKDVKRGIDLMEKAGWILKRDDVPPFVGLQMTIDGKTKAEAFFEIFRELGCRSDRDLRSVLGVIRWYLNTDEMN